MSLNPEKMAQEALKEEGLSAKYRWEPRKDGSGLVKIITGYFRRPNPKQSSPLADLMTDDQYYRIWHAIAEYSMAADQLGAELAMADVNAAIREAMTQRGGA